ncbi:polysaccharide pyruvyl transferase family protein [Marinisporobacter balticus]|uniref:Polysaccharide pyruvyl transferase WcaK-like protein n=1 Tax=Marinisporobacter balticus TaxID=2018667 RepID=A0A4R2KU95_9FIRM|nr:polysaccharide pyruvyl transferase family protein [Marinisporobacter balticus]TCO76452.1 polysaccharide pyruvyl transferase WcaK-like protein [Marinisporobacter balticus]
MNKYLLYGHGGSYNHGAEAITKETIKWIKAFDSNAYIILSTHFKKQDCLFGMPVNQYCEPDYELLVYDKKTKGKGINDKKIYADTLKVIDKDTICVSVGGDNYCYDNWHRWKIIHEYAIECGAKSILWGCSIDPSLLNDEMIEVLSSHHLITVRESLTYGLLKENGLTNLVLCPDIAFMLQPKEIKLNKLIKSGDTVAINVSPLVMRREEQSGIVVENIIYTIEYIIENTSMNIALIPHVVMPTDNDFEVLNRIYKMVHRPDRVTIISDGLEAAEYKYIFSNCRFSICSRTHASIASYSSLIPTLAIGYSIKARGIAKDLGLSEYVLPIENIRKKDDIVTMIKRMERNEIEIKEILREKIQDIKTRVSVIPINPFQKVLDVQK